MLAAWAGWEIYPMRRDERIIEPPQRTRNSQALRQSSQFGHRPGLRLSLFPGPASLSGSSHTPKLKERDMAKRIQKPRGAAGIGIIDDPDEMTEVPEAVDRAAHEPEKSPSKTKKKAKDDQQSSGNFGVSEIRKAAAFANSIGGLDKAIALLQILKVAKEVQ
jgi:hypothetical protein